MNPVVAAHQRASGPTVAAATADRLSVARKAGFTLADFACNLYWPSLTIFLLYYYTDVVGISAAAAGLIYMIASIVDAPMDPLVGILSDRTRTRWGRYRPYILFGAAPLGLAFVLLYYRPPLAGAGLLIWLLAAHIIFRAGYTLVTIPYTALTARLTPSSAERSTITGFRQVWGTLAGMVVAVSVLPLVKTFGAGDAARGFFWVAVVFACVSTAIFPIVFLSIREPRTADDTPPLSAIDCLRSLRRNRAFWIVIAGSTVSVAGTTALGKSVLYYFQYDLHDAGSARWALLAMAAIGLPLAPVWVFATNAIGKRASWFSATALGLVGLGIFALVDVTSVGLTIAFFTFLQICLSGLNFLFWSMLPDTVEYGEWRTGLRAESFLFGFAQFFLKVAVGIGVGAFGVAFGLVGYHANVAQSPQTLHGLKMIMVAFPAAGLVLGAAVMVFYPLGRGMHETIVRQLEDRVLEPPEAFGAGGAD
jgi:glycoside/pentoside/hexuronide:cation symporter, GPH family